MSNLNDPRVLFAAERTLLAWNRTSLTMIAFGFVVERSGLLMQLLAQQQLIASTSRFAHWMGIAFIGLGIAASLAAVAQYRAALRSLQPAEIPPGYRLYAGVYIQIAVALMGAALTLYLLFGGPTL